MEHLRERLQPIIAPIVTHQFGLDLIDIELKGSKANMLVRVVVDAEGGVKLDTCAGLSRIIGDKLDVADVIPGRYRLEVSSPGVDRPLRHARDFQRNLGRLVQLRFRGEEAREVEGEILAVTGSELSLKTDKGNLVVSWPEVDYGKLRIKW